VIGLVFKVFLIFFWSICINDKYFNSSFTYKLDNTKGYEAGQTHKNGRILTATAQSERYLYGVSLLFRNRNGEMINYYWRTDSNYTITISDFNDILNHNKISLVSTGFASDADCNQNSYLLQPNQNINSINSSIVLYPFLLMAVVFLCSLL